MKSLGEVTLAPAPKLGKNLQEYQQRVTEWARQAQVTVQQIADHVRLIQTNLEASGALK